MKLVNQFNYTEHASLNPQHYETPTMPSETVPGMALPLEEILRRYVRGENVTAFVPQYSDDPNLPDGIENLSEIERLDMIRDIKEGIEQFRSRPKKQPEKPIEVKVVQENLEENAKRIEEKAKRIHENLQEPTQ